jgi:hypothetical protein
MTADESEGRFVHHPGDPREAEVELAVGGTLFLDLFPGRGYRWSSVESSELSVASVAGAVDDGGAAHYVVTALSVGTAVLSATTQFTGDPYGPPTRIWRLRVAVPG